MAWKLVDMLEKDMMLAPGAWDRSTSMRGHGTEDDTDYLIITVELPDKAPASAAHGFLADLIRDHLQRATEENPGHSGPCWTDLNSDDIIDETAALLLRAAEDARKMNHLATRMRIFTKYIKVAGSFLPWIFRKHEASSKMVIPAILNGSTRTSGFRVTT